MIEEMFDKEHFEFVQKLFLRLAAPKMWGLNPEYGYTRPQVIDYNGEWYIKMGEDNTYYKEPKCDWDAAVASGLYKPTGVKVGDEEKDPDDYTKVKLMMTHRGIEKYFGKGDLKLTISNEGCIPSRDYIVKNYKLYDDNKRKGDETP